jgi:Leucine Rich repeat
MRVLVVVLAFVLLSAGSARGGWFFESDEEQATRLRSEVASALGELRIRENIGPQGAQVIAEGLKTNTALTALDLSEAYIPDGAQSLAEALKTNTALQELDLSGTFFLAANTIWAAGGWAEALKTNTALQRLYLRNNQMYDARARALAEALKTNTALQELDLTGCLFRDGGVQSLAEALKTNTVLRELDLRGTLISDAGAQALAEALKTNSALQRLYLADTHNDRIGDEGVQALAGALKINTVLQKLSWPSLTVAGAHVLADAIKGRLEPLQISFSSKHGGRIEGRGIIEEAQRERSWESILRKRLPAKLVETDLEKTLTCLHGDGISPDMVKDVSDAELLAIGVGEDVVHALRGPVAATTFRQSPWFELVVHSSIDGSLVADIVQKLDRSSLTVQGKCDVDKLALRAVGMTLGDALKLFKHIQGSCPGAE